MSPRVVFVTPWLPQYRVPFFVGLRASLEAKNIQFDLLYGAPPAEFEARRDDARLDWATAFAPRDLNIGVGHLRLTPFVRQADLVIMEQHVKQLTLYAQIAASRSRLGPPLALWGHGDGSRTVAHPLATRFKDVIARLPQQWFVYTERGADHLRDQGVDPQRIIVFNNTIDADDLLAVTPERRDTARRTLGLDDGPVALHIGGLDAAKRLDVLLDTAQFVHEREPGFKLLVAGAGSQANIVAEAGEQRPYVKYLGPVFGPGRVDAFAASDVLLHPGKVGLVAVDSFAAGRPLIGARNQMQAPEFDYLTDENSVVVDDVNAVAIGEAAIRIFRSPDRLSSLSRQARSSYSIYPLSEMIERVSTGISDFVTDPGFPIP